MELQEHCCCKYFSLQINAYSIFLNFLHSGRVAKIRRRETTLPFVNREIKSPLKRFVYGIQLHNSHPLTLHTCI